jgi:hypothetical protein
MKRIGVDADRVLAYLHNCQRKVEHASDGDLTVRQNARTLALVKIWLDSKACAGTGRRPHYLILVLSVKKIIGEKTCLPGWLAGLGPNRTSTF